MKFAPVKEADIALVPAKVVPIGLFGFAGVLPLTFNNFLLKLLLILNWVPSWSLINEVGDNSAFPFPAFWLKSKLIRYSWPV